MYLICLVIFSLLLLCIDSDKAENMKRLSFRAEDAKYHRALAGIYDKYPRQGMYGTKFRNGRDTEYEEYWYCYRRITFDDMSTLYKQDMPPIGGYPKINVQRTFPKTWFNWYRCTIVGVGVAIYGSFIQSYFNKKSWARTLEQQDISNAVMPFMKAESDRMWLLMVHRLRDEEAEAMKDVPGWKVGTWYGEPVYFTKPRNTWWCPKELDLFANSSVEEYEHGKHFRRHTNVANIPFWWDKLIPQVPHHDLY